MDNQINLMDKAKSFFLKSKRVWYVLKKPTKQEFVTIVKVSGIGIIVLGVLGFAVSLVMNIFF